MTDRNAETQIAAAGPGCSCLTTGPKYPDIVQERDIGVDKTLGRFADVIVIRCALCRRLWLRYHVEYEAFTGSGRWAKAVIDDETAAGMTPESAATYIDGAEFNVRGGSYFGHDGRRGTGKIHWDL